MKSYQNSFNEYDYYITPSEIIEFSYCNRFVYFMKCLGIAQNEEKRFKVQKGRTVHEERSAHNRGYLRKSFNVTKKMIDVPLVSKKYSIRGKVDEIYFIEDGSITILDYKFAKYEEKIYDTYRNQLILYAIMAEEVFDKQCNSGYLVYCRNENRVIKVDITRKDKEEIEDIILEYIQVIGGKYPRPTKFKARCLDCCYKNICIR